MNLQNLKKKSVMTLVAGLALGTMISTPIAAYAAEAASESVLKLKSPAKSFASQTTTTHGHKKTTAPSTTSTTSMHGHKKTTTPSTTSTTSMHGHKTSTPQGTQGGSSPATALNNPASLQADSDQIQKWMKEGKMKLYNAGAGFEWWNEESRADFEALPFSNDIEEVASHVYRVVWDNQSSDSVDYVVIVPRHVRINYGGGEEDVFDSLHIVRVANKGYDENHVMQFTPRASIWANMYDLCYIKNGRTHDVFHWSAEEEFTWNWLEEGKKEVEESTGGAIVLSGAEETYTFEATNNPNVWILHGEKDYGDYKNTWTGRMEALPGVVTPPISIPTEE